MAATTERQWNLIYFHLHPLSLCIFCIIIKFSNVLALFYPIYRFVALTCMSHIKINCESRRLQEKELNNLVFDWNRVF